MITLTLTNQKALELLAHLRALMMYSLEATYVWDAARNIRLLETETQDFQTAHKQLWEDVSARIAREKPDLKGQDAETRRTQKAWIERDRAYLELRDELLHDRTFEVSGLRKLPYEMFTGPDGKPREIVGDIVLGLMELIDHPEDRPPKELPDLPDEKNENPSP